MWRRLIMDMEERAIMAELEPVTDIDRHFTVISGSLVGLGIFVVDTATPMVAIGTFVAGIAISMAVIVAAAIKAIAVGIGEAAIEAVIIVDARISGLVII